MVIIERVWVTAEPRLLDMQEFPGGTEGLPRTSAGFLARCAVPSGVAWRVGLHAGDTGRKSAPVAMEVIEEDVARTYAAWVYCEHCIIAGWIKHPVCGKRYHFIIRNEYGMLDYKTCRHCVLKVQLFETGVDSEVKWTN